MSKLNYINQDFSVGEPLTLKKETFAVEGNRGLTSLVVDAYLSNQRTARAQAKTRGLVSGTGIKIYKQKGTGRARHGDRQAPIFVGGGKAHGPTGTQNYTKKVNQKTARKAVFATLTDFATANAITFVTALSFPKTKPASIFFQTLRVNQKLKPKSTIGVIYAPAEGIGRFLKNLATTNLCPVQTLNTYELLLNKHLVITKTALDYLTK